MDFGQEELKSSESSQYLVRKKQSYENNRNNIEETNKKIEIEVNFKQLNISYLRKRYEEKIQKR